MSLVTRGVPGSLASPVFTPECQLKLGANHAQTSSTSRVRTETKPVTLFQQLGLTPIAGTSNDCSGHGRAAGSVRMK